jgi:hypothetical protein
LPFSFGVPHFLEDHHSVFDSDGGKDFEIVAIYTITENKAIAEANGIE